MSFLNKLKSLAQQGAQESQQMLSRMTNKAFAEATMNACALITAADGIIQASERQKTAQFIMSSDKLKAFDTQALRQQYDAACDKLSRDFDFGKVDLMQTIAKIKKPEEARAVVQIAMLIGASDGDFSEDERKVTREIIRTLNLDPNEFGL